MIDEHKVLLMGLLLLVHYHVQMDALSHQKIERLVYHLEHHVQVDDVKIEIAYAKIMVHLHDHAQDQFHEWKVMDHLFKSNKILLYNHRAYFLSYI